MERTTPVIPAEDIQRQKEYCAEIRALNEQLAHAPLAYVDTYGCQQNEADSELIRDMLVEMGYDIIDTDQNSDAVVRIQIGKTPGQTQKIGTGKTILPPVDETR